MGVGTNSPCLQRQQEASQRKFLMCDSSDRLASTAGHHAPLSLALAGVLTATLVNMRLHLLLLVLGLVLCSSASQPRNETFIGTAPLDEAIAAKLATHGRALRDAPWVGVQAVARTVAQLGAVGPQPTVDTTNLLQPSDVAAQQELLAFLRQHNATVKFEPGRGCLTCSRLAFATEDLEQGDTILKLPAHLLPLLTIPAAKEGEAGVSVC